MPPVLMRFLRALLVAASLVGVVTTAFRLAERHHSPQRSPAAQLPGPVASSATSSTAGLRPRGHGSTAVNRERESQDSASSRDIEDIEAFQSWARDFLDAAPGDRAELIGAGLALAKVRESTMSRLIRDDPAKAFRLAVSPTIRSQLPFPIQERLEQHVQGRGDFLLLGATPAPGGPGVQSRQRSVIMNGREYEAFVYGKGRREATRNDIFLHGLVLGRAMAVRDDGFGGHESQLEDGNGGSAVGGNNLPPRLESARTLGTRRMLVIRVDFDDLPGEPVAAAELNTLINGAAHSFFQEVSYGRAGLIGGATTNVLRMPETAAYYATNQFNGLLHQHARALAANAGYDIPFFDRVAVAFAYLGHIPYSRIGYGALGEINGGNSWLNGFFQHRFVTHELGHNLGLAHANFWQPSDGTPIGAGQSVEYKDLFDTMGENGGSDDYHYNPWFKYMLRWMNDAEVLTVTNSGIYRVKRFDHRQANGTLALRIPRGDGSRDYWVGLRQRFPSDPSLFNGAYIVWGYRSLYRPNDLLDFSPQIPSSINPLNPGLKVGSSFYDAAAGLTIRTLAKGGSAPNEYLDVEIAIGAGPPSIAIEPLAVRLYEGGTATFSASAVGAYPLHYQWLQNGFFIPGATNASFTLTNATFTNSGQLTLVITNRMGLAVAAAGTVVVGPTRLVAWGADESGQCSIPPGATNPVAMAAGEAHSAAIREDETVVAWGLNDRGQSAVPAGLRDVIAISSSAHHTLALSRGSALTVWGSNSHGQGTIPAGMTGVVAIAAGHYHNLALRQDGTVIAWGDNTWGQCSVPLGLDRVVAIAAGYGHSVALHYDGQITAWGLNDALQAGVPAGLNDAATVSAGRRHTLALRRTMIPVLWGDNAAGQTSLPVEGLLRAAAAGHEHNVGIMESGALIAWGANEFGQTSVPSDLPGALFVTGGGRHSLALLPPNEATPRLAISPAQWDFGVVPVGSSLLRAFLVSNHGLQPLEGSAAIASGEVAFAVAGGSPFHRNGGQTGVVVVRFQPATEGLLTGTVVVDSNGGTSTNALFGRGALMPHAVFSAVTIGGPAPLTVTFHDESTGTITNRVWDFGDGASLATTALQVVHTYLNAGLHTISLTVHGPLGSSSTNRVGYIAVSPSDPEPMVHLRVLNLTNLALGGGVAGASYTVEISTNLVEWWTHQWVTNLPGTAIISVVPGDGSQFFRAKRAAPDVFLEFAR